MIRDSLYLKGEEMTDLYKEEAHRFHSPLDVVYKGSCLRTHISLLGTKCNSEYH